MSKRTIITLFFALFNALWLCVVFIILWIHGEVIIPEPNRWFAGFEIALTAVIAGMVIERLCKLKERK
jgi:hypothetical protein